MQSKLVAVVLGVLVGLGNAAPALATAPMVTTAISGSRVQVFTVWPGAGDRIRLTESRSDKSVARFSWDRVRIAYVAANRSGGSVNVMRGDGTNPRRLLDFPAIALAWSPNDRYLLVEARSSIYRVRVASRTTPSAAGVRRASTSREPTVERST